MGRGEGGRFRIGEWGWKKVRDDHYWNFLLKSIIICHSAPHNVRNETKLYSLGFFFFFFYFRIKTNARTNTRRWRMRTQDQPNGAFILLLRLLFALVLPEYICSNNKKWLFCSLLFYRPCLQRSARFSCSSSKCLPSPMLICCCFRILAMLSFIFYGWGMCCFPCCSLLHRCNPLGP